MRVIPLSDRALQEAIRVLRHGGTVIVPTETAYGLAADPRNPDAVKRLFAIKGRDAQKPLGLMAGSLKQVRSLCEMNAAEKKLAERWPAPLSIVLQLRENLSTKWLNAFALVTAGSNRVSIRVSGHPWVRQLCLAFGFPLIATSANMSGAGEVFDPRAFNSMLNHPPQPDLLINGGVLPRSAMSTVICVVHGTPQVLRAGAVKVMANDEPQLPQGKTRRS